MTSENSRNRELDHLLSMANDIAANLSFHDDGKERIADHINRFWAPRMRRLLLDYAVVNPDELSEHVLQAIPKIRR